MVSRHTCHVTNLENKTSVNYEYLEYEPSHVKVGIPSSDKQLIFVILTS